MSTHAKESIQDLRMGLSSLDARQRRDALFRVVNKKTKEVSEDVLELMLRETDPDVRSRCAWALGKLGYAYAYPFLVKNLRDKSHIVRIWSAWALGELGLEKACKPLIMARSREHNSEVRRSIGGALKKLAGESARVHKSQVMKSLKPPTTDDAATLAIVAQLQNLQWPQDSESILALRAAMKRRNPGYFEQYMRWMERTPTLRRILEDDEKVFS